MFHYQEDKAVRIGGLKVLATVTIGIIVVGLLLYGKHLTTINSQVSSGLFLTKWN